MTDRIAETLKEWQAHNSHQDSYASAHWFCRKVNGYEVRRAVRYTPDGKVQEIYVPSNGKRRITEMVDAGENSSSIW